LWDSLSPRGESKSEAAGKMGKEEKWVSPQIGKTSEKEKKGHYPSHLSPGEDVRKKRKDLRKQEGGGYEH